MSYHRLATLFVALAFFGAAIPAAKAAKCQWFGTAPLCGEGKCPQGWQEQEKKACINGWKVYCCASTVGVETKPPGGVVAPGPVEGTELEKGPIEAPNPIERTEPYKGPIVEPEPPYVTKRKTGPITE